MSDRTSAQCVPNACRTMAERVPNEGRTRAGRVPNECRMSAERRTLAERAPNECRTRAEHVPNAFRTHAKYHQQPETTEVDKNEHPCQKLKMFSKIVKLFATHAKFMTKPVLWASSLGFPSITTCL